MFFYSALLAGSTVGVYFSRVQFITCQSPFSLALAFFFLFNVVRVRLFRNVSVWCVSFVERRKGHTLYSTVLYCTIPHLFILNV